MSDVDVTFDRDWLRKALQEGTCVVEFEKLDGTLRQMKCTLNPNDIPADKMDFKGKRSSNPAVLPVYDVEKEAWRSFRIDSVKSVET